MPREMAADDLSKLVAEAQAAQEGGGAGPYVQDLDDDAEDGGEAVDAQQGVPAWAKVPEGFAFPAGWTVWFIRFPARMTNRPRGGERQCIVWNLSEADEKRASRAARGDGLRIIDEMTKATIRSIDGQRIKLGPSVAAAAVGQSGEDAGFANVTTFWTEIGGKCRHQLKSLYLKNHVMEAAENADFFENCVAPRSVG
jgi:hypothetical protein